MRVPAIGLALLLAACTSAPPVTAGPTPTATHEAGTIAVTALLDLSGIRAPKGDAQRSAMLQWVEAQRGTPRLRLRIVDVGGSDAKLLLELKRGAEAGDADAFVIGVPIVVGDALSHAIGLAKRPVLFTLPVPDPVAAGDGGRWMFGLAPSPDALARASVDALPSRTTPAIIVTSGTLLAGREELAIMSLFRAQERPMPFVMSASPDVRDTFAQRLRPYASAGAAVFFTGPASDYLSPVRLIPLNPADSASGLSLFLSYLTDANDASRLGDAAPTTRWPALRRTIGSAQGSHAASATDALALLAFAGDGTGDAERSRARIEDGTFVGIATTYRFTPTRHTGADLADISLVAWDGGRIVAARPIGATR